MAVRSRTVRRQVIVKQLVETIARQPQGFGGRLGRYLTSSYALQNMPDQRRGNSMSQLRLFFFMPALYTLGALPPIPWSLPPWAGE